MLRHDVGLELETPFADDFGGLDEVRSVGIDDCGRTEACAREARDNQRKRKTENGRTCEL
jgi:hypothetical protein